MPVLPDVVVILFSSIIVLTPNDNILLAPVLLYSVNDMYRIHAPMFLGNKSPPSSGQKLRKDNA